MVTVLNFGHPLTDEQRSQLEGLLDQVVTDVKSVRCQLDPTQPFEGQIRDLVDGLGISAGKFQSEAFVVGLPGMAPATAALLAELHGRMGYFPTAYRLAQREGVVPPVFDVAEVMNLQDVRNRARQQR